MTKRAEVDLNLPVQEWIKKQGYVPYAEVPHYSSCIDLVGINWIARRVIIVELKLGCTEKVLRQATMGLTMAHKAYAAVASKPRQSSLALAAKMGVGVLRVGIDGDVSELLSAKEKEPWTPQLNKTLDTMKDWEPGGVAGLPQQKGEGPAQDCGRRVAEYRKQHPCATWKEIYENVGNHYCSHGSMSGALVSRGLA